MLLIVISVLGYLFLCAKVGKYLRDKNASMSIKRVCGLVALLINVAPIMFVGIHGYFLAAFGMACGVLGYVTVVYRPKWIVGNR